MNELIKLNGIYNPKKIIVIYEHNNTKSVYIEEHLFKNNNIGLGVALQGKTLSELGNSFHKLKLHSIGGTIPSNLLYSNITRLQQKIVWISEPCIRYLKFDNMKIEDGLYPIPKMLWVYNHGNLNVFCIDDKSNIYFTPYPNVNSKGEVCMGSASKFIKHNNISNYQQCMNTCEGAFFSSIFTHYSHDKCVKGNVVNVMNKCLNGKKFPVNVLIKTKYSLEDFYG